MNSFKKLACLLYEFTYLSKESQWVSSFLNWIHLFLEVMEEMNSRTLPNKLACSPSLMVEVLISSINKSWMLLSSSKTLGYSKKAVQEDKVLTSHPLDVHTWQRNWASCHAWSWTPTCQHEVRSPAWRLSHSRYCMYVSMTWKSVSTEQKRSNKQKNVQETNQTLQDDHN